MLNDDQNPGEGGAVEATDHTVVPAAEPQTPPADTPSNGDPLDDIQDPTARADAKKHRAIARRTGGKDDTPAPVPAPSGDVFAKKDDIARLVTSQAKELVSPEIRDNWDKLLEIPLAGYDPLDARSIAKNMEERQALLKVRNGEPKGSDPANDLRSTPGIRGGSGVTPEPAPQDPPRFALPTQPKDWYPKKS